MGCCNCNCINKLEHVEKVIAEYDPTEKFINYKLLTIWLNRKTGKAFILVSKKDGIAVWQPIDLETTAIEKIILNCGEVEANENNEIEHVGECGARTVTDDCKDLCITINTDWGLKGGGTVCAGESLSLGIDLANTSLVISNVKDVQQGDLVAFDGTSGKVITKSNINSVDGLTKIVKSTSGEQRFVVENTAGNDSVIQAKTTGNGYSYIQLSNNDDEWFASLNRSQKQLEIFPKVNGENKSPILTMLPNGVMLMPWQPKLGATFGTAKLDQANVSRDIGGFGGGTFTTILDQDGYNLSAGNFYPGDGAGQGAFYTTTYDNAFYLVVIQFLVQKDDRNAGATTNIAIQYQGTPSYIFRKELISGIKFETFVGVTVLRGVKGNKISFSLASTNQNIEITNFGGGARENYVGVYMLG